MRKLSQCSKKRQITQFSRNFKIDNEEILRIIDEDNSLHLNVVTKLMKITAIRQGKWGWSVPRGEGAEGF